MEKEKMEKEKESTNEQEGRAFFPPYNKLGYDMNYNPLLDFEDEEEA